MGPHIYSPIDYEHWRKFGGCSEAVPARVLIGVVKLSRDVRRVISPQHAGVLNSPDDAAPDRIGSYHWLSTGKTVDLRPLGKWRGTQFGDRSIQFELLYAVAVAG